MPTACSSVSHFAPIPQFLACLIFSPAQVYLNLVLEYVPDTVYRINKHYTKNEQRMPIILVKLYTYQMLRALAHIHSVGVCHRCAAPGLLRWIGARRVCDPQHLPLTACSRFCPATGTSSPRTCWSTSTLMH